MPIRTGPSEKTGSRRRKIELNFEVEDFGPIGHGRVTLKPLTLFVGPNNSGKSYLAMLMHSVFEAYSPTGLPKGAPFFVRRSFLSKSLNVHVIAKQFQDMKAQMGDLREGREVAIPQEFIQGTGKRIFEEIYERRLSDEIIRSYACRLRELVRVGKKSFALKIGLDSHTADLTYQKGSMLKLNAFSELDVKISIKPCATLGGIRIQRGKKSGNVLLEISKKLWKDNDFAFPFFNILLDICLSKVSEMVPTSCFYLPAARSGILQGHKALAAGIIRRAPLAGLERMEIEPFSGVVSDFISSVITLPEKKGRFYKLARDFEREVIDGEILVRTLGEHPYPEIRYRFEKTEIPLHRASSTVSELAPLFLYLKYSIEPGSILIIEEPEAHLHPGNQRILAKFLIRLVRSGVHVTITTHSDYLLKQLSTFILLSKVSPENRVRYEYSQEDFLVPDEVAAYVFHYDKKSGGHAITTIPITEEGIPQEEFLKIHEALYEETFKLQRDLTSET
ncbi:MAG: AAA family ATPase [Planctomycetota bacterium]|nr:AAA family ATPase [Planctomycetota bacterium]